MSEVSYVYVVDLDVASRSLLRFESIKAAVTFVDRYEISCRNVVVYASRFDEILAFKSNVLLTQTFIPRLHRINKVPYEK